MSSGRLEIWIWQWLEWAKKDPQVGRIQEARGSGIKKSSGKTVGTTVAQGDSAKPKPWGWPVSQWTVTGQDLGVGCHDPLKLEYCLMGPDCFVSSSLPQLQFLSWVKAKVSLDTQR